MSRRFGFFIGLSLLIGLALRVSLGGDIEYKGDERTMYEFAQATRRTGEWPAVGMGSGVSVVNPGMSVWVFVILAKAFQAHGPVELAHAVQILNSAALMMMAWFAWLRLKEDREAWLWSVALIAVNPIALIYQRKLWAQSVLPMFCLLALMGWLARDRRRGALAWGFFGAILGQIHLSGFFYSLAFAASTAWRQRRLGREAERVDWKGWLMGSAAGAVFLLPWLSYLLRGEGRSPSGYHFREVLKGKFLGYWIADPLGLDLSTFLGKETQYDFLDSWAGAACLGIALLGVLIAVTGWRRLLPRDRSPTSTAVRSSLLGEAFTALSGAIFHRHYMLISFPCEWLWLSRMALAKPRRGRVLLGALWVLQLVVSVMLLHFIHVNHGAEHGDYGVVYDHQKQKGEGR